MRIPGNVLGSLRQHRARQLEERLTAGPRWRDGFGLVFTTIEGAPLHSSTVTHDFQRKLARAGLPTLRFHDLRHSCSSLLQAQGVPPRVVMDILGHATLTMTVERYGHSLPEGLDAAARSMDRALGEDRE